MKEDLSIKGKIQFNGSEIDIIYPNNYDDLKNKLGEIFGLHGDFISNFTLTYDINNEGIEIENPIDYQKFYTIVSKVDETIPIKVEVNEISNIDLQKCSSSFVSYKDNNSQESNINHDENNIIENNNYNKLIINNNYINEENNNNIINEENNNNIINEESNNNIINENNKNNIFGKSNNNNNIIMNNNINNNIPNIEMTMLCFPYVCSICKGGPIYQVMYLCKQCNQIFCYHCEPQEGPKHKHPYLKVQTEEQFESCNISGKNVVSIIGDKIGNAFDSTLEFFGKEKNEEQEKIKKIQQNPPLPQRVTLVQVMRSLYDLGNISDQQIEEALLKTSGNFDEAVILLTCQDN